MQSHNPIKILLHQVDPRVQGAIKQSINRLLALGLSDDSQDIRISVFTALDPALDPYLASPVNVDLLFTATKDESFEVRSAVMKCIARLTQQDPPRILPLLRKIWVGLMKEVTSERERSKSAQESLLLVQSLLQVGGCLE